MTTEIMEQQGKREYSWEATDYEFQEVVRHATLDEVKHRIYDEDGDQLGCPCGKDKLYAFGKDRVRCCACGRLTKVRMLPLLVFTPVPKLSKRRRMFREQMFRELPEVEEQEIGEFED